MIYLVQNATCRKNRWIPGKKIYGSVTLIETDRSTYSDSNVYMRKCNLMVSILKKCM